ncbi:MAG: hypothetical protein KF773_20445 [Deltaproteobacteria bacterium]|nr:hypothetical protein [Deltaproteobacteria bacterium]
MRTHLHLLLLLLLLLAACGAPDAPSDTPDRRAFIEKAHHALHPTSPPLTAAQLEELVAKSDDEVIAALYADPATREAVFKLSLAYLGAPVDQLRTDGRWAVRPFGFSPAVSAARAFRDGGDPLAPLLTTRATAPRGVVMPIDEYVVGYYYPRAVLQGTNSQKRAALTKAAVDDVLVLRGAVAALPEPLDAGALCDRYFASTAAFAALILPQLYGVPAAITDDAQPLELGQPAALPLDDACQNGAPITRDAALARLDDAAQLFGQLGARLDPILAAWETDEEGAFDPVDFPSIGFYSPYDQPVFGRSHFYPQFWTAAQNSSTNYDRRRGAYVLDRYFCDDLKPVGAALPTEHGGDRHASDPSCAACHFKLDPMAGFFRRQGFFGTDFNQETLNATGGQIIFDDFAQLSYREYEKAWLAPAGAGRTFDIGYIRSTRDPSVNSYGDSLADLDELLRTAPEVERCFAQRMFEHFNGADQAVDPGFLDDVAADMHAAGGAQRLERGLARILTGATFRAPDRNTNVCYDVAPGTGGAHRPPCEVASILRTHCASCHAGGNVQGGLDVARWEPRDGGRFGFVHTSASRAEVFARMLDRVSTSDLARQMPQARDMPLRAREQLALWLQKMIDAE